jgi:photosystem II stability/assembly factor-like uncharacterized protein
MLTNVRFASARKGWAVGHSGVVLVSDDGGANWSRQLDGGVAAEIILRSARERAATVGDEGTKRALADAQRLAADGADKPFLDVLVDDERTVTVVGAYGLALHSADGGKTWEDWQPRIPNTKGSHLYAIRRAGATIVLAGEQGSVFRSTDGGQRFAAVVTPYAGSFFGALATSAQRIVVFGLQGNAYTTSDGGANWTRGHTGTAAPLVGGTVLDDGSIVLVSQAGQVLHSADGGLAFTPVEVKQPVPYVGVGQAPDGRLVLAGVRGMTRTSLNVARAKP